MTPQVAAALIRAAQDARLHAYAPYSGYYVGAALLTEDDRVYLGCNIENASYGITNCAERTALFNAVSEGERSFRAIAIVGSPQDTDPKDAPDYAYPCGACRQALSEFCGPDFLVVAAKSVTDYEVYSLGELMPKGFGAGML
ncbi:MAG: cytidine deaminase [Lachnospiraceae bacterium]|nr:cytidine deaminase [Lachnospiraceae bacterium]MCR5477894.1 cytidine deaminase [Lachnospiraceae bacterium]